MHNSVVSSVRESSGAQKQAAPKAKAASHARFAQCKATGLHLSIRPLEAGPELLAEWRALARRSLVPNIFYEPEYAIPAAIPFGKGVQLLAVHADASEDASLLAVWPFRIARFRWGVPLATIFGWTHPFAASGVPLLDKDRAAEAITALLNVASSFRGLPARALLPLVPDEGPFSDALRDVQTRLSLREQRTEGHDRAFLTPGRAPDPLVHLSSGSRSKLRQELRRLEKEAPVTLYSVEAPDEMEAALENYLELEAAGWKGRAGTAIPSSPAETQFMRDSTRNLAEERRVRIDQLKLGDRVIASSITYRNGPVVWYAKISFDEAHAKNSPGSQLVVKVTEVFNADTSITFADSCAPPHHPLMRRFWPERMNLSHRMIEMAGKDPLFPLAGRLEEQRPVMREYYHAAKRWVKSRRQAKPPQKSAAPAD